MFVKDFVSDIEEFVAQDIFEYYKRWSVWLHDQDEGLKPYKNLYDAILLLVKKIDTQQLKSSVRDYAATVSIT